MGALYDIPRQFLIGLAEDGTIHYTFLYEFVVNGFLCAFVIGPLLGGMGTMVPGRRAEIASLGLKSILAGTLATMLTGTMVGILS